jgi:hypothetical protein
MFWLWKGEQILLKNDPELSHKVQELRQRIDTLRKNLEDDDYVREVTKENTESMGTREEKKSTEIRVEDASQDFEKEKRNTELDDIRSKLRRK